MALPIAVACLLLLLSFPSHVTAFAVGSNFTLSSNSFLLNGVPVLIRSGSLHYSRVHPSDWEDRLDRLKAMGMNAVQFYIPWNYHESDFQGNIIDFTSPSRDVVRFIEMIGERDMMALVRPGPYICGEWEFGGLPARLLSTPSSPIRTLSLNYMSSVKTWFGHLLPLLTPHLIQNGGPIVMAQVENEFGSYGDVENNPDDEGYMRSLVDIFRSHLGSDLVLYTTDGGNVGAMRRGSLPGDDVLTLGDFGPGASISASIEGQSYMNPEGANPAMCTEYYTGWLTHYGEELAATDAGGVVKTLEDMILRDVSFNLYMAHGGTSFGFWSGANGNGGTDYKPDITSYDYNSPVGEDGRHGFGSDGLDKYTAIRDLMTKYFEDVPVEPEGKVVKGYGVVEMGEVSVGGLKDIIGEREVVQESKAVCQEGLGQRFGLTSYTFTTGSCNPCNVTLIGLSDYATVYVDGVFLEGWYRGDGGNFTMESVGEGRIIDVVVEGMGRINYGRTGMGDRKGLGGIEVDGVEVEGVKHRIMELDSGDLDAVEYMSRDDDGEGRGGSRFYKGAIDIDRVEGATFVDVSSFGKGYVFVNGFNLGRYWSAKGPVLTLYVPEGVMVEGKNEVVVVELEEGGEGGRNVVLVDEPKVVEKGREE